VLDHDLIDLAPARVFARLERAQARRPEVSRGGTLEDRTIASLYGSREVRVGKASAFYGSVPVEAKEAAQRTPLTGLRAGVKRASVSTPMMATASSDASRAQVLLMPEAMPTSSGAMASKTRVVRGVTLIAIPSPTVAMGGKNVDQDDPPIPGSANKASPAAVVPTSTTISRGKCGGNSVRRLPAHLGGLGDPPRPSTDVTGLPKTGKKWAFGLPTEEGPSLQVGDHVRKASGNGVRAFSRTRSRFHARTRPGRPQGCSCPAGERVASRHAIYTVQGRRSGPITGTGGPNRNSTFAKPRGEVAGRNMA